MSEPEEAVSKWLSPTVTSEILVGVVVTLFIVFLLVLFSYLYTKRYSGAVPAIRSSQLRFILPADHPAGAAGRGLDPQVLRALPITVFQAKDTTFECAVCLTEMSGGEKARMLPNCGHGFHLECIDTWFQSHITCPLCRIPVSLPEPPKDADFGFHLVEISPETAVSDGKQEGSSSSGGLSTPGSPLPTSRPAVEETKAGMSARLRSLRRLWSSGMWSSRGDGGDVERGVATTSTNP